MIAFTVNGKRVEVDASADTPLLWVLRDHLNLTGTKFGCGIAQCGACTVHVDGAATRACATPVSAVAGKKVTTIEAIGANKLGKAVQQAWLDLDTYRSAGQRRQRDPVDRRHAEGHARSGAVRPGCPDGEERW